MQKACTMIREAKGERNLAEDEQMELCDELRLVTEALEESKKRCLFLQDENGTICRNFSLWQRGYKHVRKWYREALCHVPETSAEYFKVRPEDAPKLNTAVKLLRKKQERAKQLKEMGSKARKKGTKIPSGGTGASSAADEQLHSKSGRFSVSSDTPPSSPVGEDSDSGGLRRKLRILRVELFGAVLGPSVGYSYVGGGGDVQVPAF